MNQEASVRRLGWGLTAVGVVLAAIAGFLALNTAGTESWIEVEGVVVDVDKEEGVVIGTTIRYRDTEDNAYDLKSDYGTEESRRGEKVMLQYDPVNPNDALLSGESTGTSIHWVFVIAFGLLAVWGAVIALFDPQLPEVINRPGGVSASTIWIVLFSVIGFLTLRGTFSGGSEVIVWLLLVGGIVATVGLWRMLSWGRWVGLGFAAAVTIGLIVAWARNENRFGAPLFWYLLLLFFWAMVILALSRREVAASIAREQKHRRRLSAA